MADPITPEAGSYRSTPPNNWFRKEGALAEFSRLNFAVQALAETCGTQGSYEREMAANAANGIRSRLEYLRDSVARLLQEKP